jgi:hypothetical protein
MAPAGILNSHPCNIEKKFQKLLPVPILVKERITKKYADYKNEGTSEI